MTNQIQITQELFEKLALENENKFTLEREEVLEAMTHAPITEGELLTGKVMFKFKVSDMKISGTIIISGIESIRVDVFKFMPSVIKTEALHDNLRKEFAEGLINSTASDVLTAFVKVMIKMANPDSEKHITKSEKKSTDIVRKKVKGKNKLRTIKVTKTIYTINDSINNLKTREYNRHVESWTQRGHWREYKSGKRIWIKPQLKGVKNGTIATKKYKL